MSTGKVSLLFLPLAIFIGARLVDSGPLVSDSLRTSFVFCTFIMYLLRVRPMLSVALYSPLHVANAQDSAGTQTVLNSRMDGLSEGLVVDSPSR